MFKKLFPSVITLEIEFVDAPIISFASLLYPTWAVKIIQVKAMPSGIGATPENNVAVSRLWFRLDIEIPLTMAKQTPVMIQPTFI